MNTAELASKIAGLQRAVDVPLTKSIINRSMGEEERTRMRSNLQDLQVYKNELLNIPILIKNANLSRDSLETIG